MNRPVERVTGSTSTPFPAKRRTKCRLCPEYIQKGEARITSTGVEREWINGEFRDVLKTRHEHAHHMKNLLVGHGEEHVEGD
jgi:hypothetical protein